MCSFFIARAKTNRWDSRFARPIYAVRREVPLATWGFWQTNMFTRQLSRLDERMILLQCPCREIFIHGENKSCIGRLVIKEFFQFDGIAIFFRDQRFDLRPNLLFGFSKCHAAVNKNDGFIRHCVDGWGFDMQITDRNLPMTQKRMIAKLWFEVANASN